MGLPKDLTPEEEYLLKKFALLKRKKKALQKAKEKTETAKVTKPGNKRDVPEQIHAPEDAKEIAKKLIASGEVKIKKEPVHREFKRAKTEGRKQREGHHGSQTVKHRSTSPGQNEAQKHNRKNLYDSFVPSSGTRAEYSGSDSRRHSEEKRQGKTIFVKGAALTEDILHKSFNKFGELQRVHFEKEKGHGFVTFNSCEAADKAIAEMNGSMVSGVCIKVSLAWRQPNMDDSHPHGRPSWSSRDGRGGAPAGQAAFQEKRELVNYAEDF